MVKVLVVIDSLVPAGAERSLVQTAPLLRDRDVDLEVVTIHDRPGLQQVLIDEGIRVDALDGSGRLAWARGLSSHIDRFRPDLVHTTLFEAGLAGRLAGRRHRVPVLSTYASEPYGPERFDNPGRPTSKVRAAQATEILSLRLARRVHAVSDPVAESVATRLRYPRDRIDVVTRGRDPEWIGRRSDERRRTARAMLGVVDDQLLALTVARNEYIKGLDTLIDAAPSILASAPSTVFLIAGRPTPITEELQARARDRGLGDRLRFLGERSDVPDLLAAADVFVLPTRNEGFPGAVVEAMAMEVPVLATDIPTVRVVVDDATAVLVPVDDPAALANGFEDAVHGSRRRDRVKCARTTFEQRLTLAPVADAMAAMYRTCAGMQ